MANKAVIVLSNIPVGMTARQVEAAVNVALQSALRGRANPEDQFGQFYQFAKVEQVTVTEDGEVLDSVQRL